MFVGIYLVAGPVGGTVETGGGTTCFLRVAASSNSLWCEEVASFGSHFNIKPVVLYW